MGELDIKVPRDRNGEYEPKIIGKYNRNVDGMEEKILSLYACGMSQRDIAEQIKKADQAIKKAQKPQDVYDLLGLNLDDDKKKAISESFEFATEQLNAYLDAWVKAAQKKVELANQEVDSA